MSDTTIQSNERGRLVHALVQLGLILLVVTFVPRAAWADHPCSTNPNWPAGQLCSTDPSWPAGQDNLLYDPGCAQDGAELEYLALCMQEGENGCNPASPFTCMECWDCIDNDGDGLFDCMDNLDAEGNDSTNYPQPWMNGGCALYCTLANPAGMGAYDQDMDDDGFLSCPWGPPDPAPPIYDCDDNNGAIHSGAAENCTDGIDNDCDELVDAADPDCTGDDDDSATSDDDDSTTSDDDDSTPADDDDSTPAGDDDSAPAGDDDSAPAGDDDSAPAGDDDDADGGNGCSCSSTQSRTHTSLGLALLVGLVGLGLLRRQTTHNP
jgi:MYXO-CTERM domain-containing protein